MSKEHHHVELGEPDIIRDVAAPTTSTAEYRRVSIATMFGTTIEWHDYFIYALIASIVFGKLFFSGLGEWNQLAALATVGVAFFFRPLGAVAMGPLGDKLGRRFVLVFTMVGMGAATALIGLLPTTQQIGVGAPILLILLRCLQGFAAGGQWGGAAMLAVEHAPHGKRGWMGAYPQMGVPGGMVLASAVLLILTNVMSPAAFLDWGWRLPFLFSIILIFAGNWVRNNVEDSPVFLELKEAKKNATSPLKELMKTDGKRVLIGALTFMGTQALGYMLVGGFILGYANKVGGFSVPSILLWTMVASALWIVVTFAAAAWSDRKGRTFVYKVGYIAMALMCFPIFWLVKEGVEQKNLTLVGLALVLIAIPEGLTYGPQSAMFAELFPVRVRLSGVSIAYALGAVLGGAFAPTIAEYLQKTYGTVVAVAPYLTIVALISLTAVFFVKDKSQEPLHTMSGH